MFDLVALKSKLGNSTLTVSEEQPVPICVMCAEMCISWMTGSPE